MIFYSLVYVNEHDKVIEAYNGANELVFEGFYGIDSLTVFDALGKSGWQMCGVDNKDSAAKNITAYWFSNSETP